jgi:hypothetical protein
LGKTAPGSGAEDLNAHDDTRTGAINKANIKCNKPASESGRYKGWLDGLKLGVGVRADFAVQVDLFVLRGNPFHERCSLRELNDGQENSTIRTKRNRENPLGRIGGDPCLRGLSAEA